ncbi:hypothetical protein [Agromyces bauzanensis]
MSETVQITALPDVDAGVLALSANGEHNNELDGLALFCEAAAWLYETDGSVGFGRGSRPYRGRLAREVPGVLIQPSDRAGHELKRLRRKRDDRRAARRLVMFEALGWRVQPDPTAAAALAAVGRRVHVSTAADRAVSGAVAESFGVKMQNRRARWVARVQLERPSESLGAPRWGSVARVPIDAGAASVLAAVGSRLHVPTLDERRAHSDAVTRWAHTLGSPSQVARARREADLGWLSSRGWGPVMTPPTAAELASARADRARVRALSSGWAVVLTMVDGSTRRVPVLGYEHGRSVLPRLRLAAGVERAFVRRVPVRA